MNHHTLDSLACHPLLELEQLLRSLFGSAKSLQMFLHRHLGEAGVAIVRALPAPTVSLDEYVYEAVGALSYGGLLSPAFFDALIAVRPGRRDDILRVQDRFLAFREASRGLTLPGHRERRTMAHRRQLAAKLARANEILIEFVAMWRERRDLDRGWMLWGTFEALITMIKSAAPTVLEAVIIEDLLLKLERVSTEPELLLARAHEQESEETVLRGLLMITSYLREIARELNDSQPTSVGPSQMSGHRAAPMPAS